MYRVYCPNYILNEWEVNWKRYFLQKECWNAIDYLRANMNYQKFSNSLQVIRIHNKGQALQNFTLMVDTRGLADSASLKIITHNGRNSGGHNWPKTILGGACCYRYVNTFHIVLDDVYTTWRIHSSWEFFIGISNQHLFMYVISMEVIPIASRLCTWYVAKFGYVVQITEQTS